MAQVYLKGFTFLIPSPNDTGKEITHKEETMVRQSASFHEQRNISMHKQVLLQNMSTNRSGMMPVSDDGILALEINLGLININFFHISLIYFA